jgi:hypothetical protein
VELCPRVLEVLKRHLALRAEYVTPGKIRHEHLFFLEDGRPISDPEITRWRWSESIKALSIRRRGPYHARHSSVTWQLMLGKNLLWVAKQHGHSVEVMLRMYAAWLEGATDSDVHAIEQAMEKRPSGRAAFLDSRTAISSINAARNHVAQIVIRPPESPEFGSSLAIGKCPGTQVSEMIQKLSGGEGGIARGRGRPLVLRFASDRRGWAAASKNRSAIFVEPT